MDREKVIEQLENDAIATDTGYVEVPLWLFSEILALLKEQDAVARCKDCIYWDEGHTEECDNLDSVCFHNGWCKPDWFCGDGKRKEGR